MASDTQQICARHSESTVRFECRRSWCLRRLRIRLESLGAGCRRMGTRFWNCVGRCSQIHRFFLGTVSSWVHTPTVPLFEQLCCDGVTLPETSERIPPCQLEMERAQMMTGCKLTLSRKARGRAKANTKTRREIARPTRALQTSTRVRPVAELDIGRKTAGDQVEERTTIPPVTTATLRKARVTRKAKRRANTWTLWKRISLLKQPQPCRILHKHRVQLENSLASQTWNRRSWV